MKTNAVIIMLGALLTAAHCLAATHYVVTNGTPDVTPTDPYTNWATAGTSVIDVVNAAMTNSWPRLVWVTNGTYLITNQINVTNSLTIQSVNGYSNTVFNGNYPALSNTAFYILNNDSGKTGIVDGITVTNFAFTNLAHTGAICVPYSANSSRVIIRNCLITGNRGKHSNGTGDGGGIYIYNTDVINCIIRGNTAQRYGGGFVLVGSVIIRDSLIEGNSCGYDFVGGGAYAAGGDINISNCFIISNTAADGGGICFFGASKSGRTITDCVITGNTAKGYNSTYSGQGGGVGFQGDCSIPPLIQNCHISGNYATNSGGGISGPNFILRNCLVSGNVARTNAGGVLCQTGIVESCTIIGNTAGVSGGGLYFSTVSVTGLNNIVYFNTSLNATNFTNTIGNTGLNYSCTIPAVDGTGNITNNPFFKNLAAGDYDLSMNSPCVNAGTNQDWMTNALDLGGNTRILNGIVDMGAYERLLWQGTIYRFQ